MKYLNRIRYGLTKAATRFSPVFVATFLLSLVVVPAAFAVQFPYFGPLKKQEEFINAGFIHADNLFQMISQPGQALYFLALTGALVGFLQIVFKAENRSPSILAGWLVVVLCLLVAPVSSKLLFYPLAEDNVGQNYVAPTGEAKGFTPQVLAIHIPSVITNVLYSYFQGKGYQDLVQRAVSRQKFAQAGFNTMSPRMVAEVRSYEAACGTAPLPKAILNSTDQASLKNKQQNYKYGDVMSHIDNYRTNTKITDNTIPPPAILLPASYADIPQTWIDNGLVDKYWEGLTAMAGELNIDYTTAGSYPQDTNAIKNLVDLIFAENNKFKSCGGDQCDIAGHSRMSFYVAKATKTSTSGTGETFSVVDGSNADVEIARNYRKTAGASWADVGASIYNATIFSEFSGNYQPNTYLNTNYDAESTLLKDSLVGQSVNAVVADMPVVLGQVDTSKAFGPTATEQVVYGSVDCLNRGDTLARSILYNQMFKGESSKLSDFGKPDNSGNFNLQFYEDLVSKDNVYDTMDGNQIAAQVCDRYLLIFTDSDSCKASDDAEALEVFFNDVIAQNNKFDSLSADEKQSLLVASIIQSGYKNGSDMVDAATIEDAILNPTTTSQFAQTKLIDGAVTVGSLATKGVVSVIASLIGFLSRLFIEILIVFINMALTGIIVITPLAMLSGLVVPRNALGVIVSATMAVFVLKFVPITFMLINQVTSLLATVFGYVDAADGKGMWAAVKNMTLGSFSENLMIIAASLMYMNVVGLTLFILFKIGDVNNISKLGMLDGHAKRLADVGKKMVNTAAIGAGMVVGSAALGMKRGGIPGAKVAAGKRLRESMAYNKFTDDITAKDSEISGLESSIANRQAGQLNDEEKAQLEQDNQQLDMMKAERAELQKQQQDLVDSTTPEFTDYVSSFATSARAGLTEGGEIALQYAMSQMPGGGGRLLQEIGNAGSEGKARAMAVIAAGGFKNYKDQVKKSEAGKYLKNHLAYAQGAGEYDEMENALFTGQLYNEDMYDSGRMSSMKQVEGYASASGYYQQVSAAKSDGIYQSEDARRMGRLSAMNETEGRIQSRGQLDAKLDAVRTGELSMDDVYKSGYLSGVGTVEGYVNTGAKHDEIMNAKLSGQYTLDDIRDAGRLAAFDQVRKYNIAGQTLSGSKSISQGKEHSYAEFEKTYKTTDEMYEAVKGNETVMNEIKNQQEELKSRREQIDSAYKVSKGANYEMKQVEERTAKVAKEYKDAIESGTVTKEQVAELKSFRQATLSHQMDSDVAKLYNEKRTELSQDKGLSGPELSAALNEYDSGELQTIRVKKQAAIQTEVDSFAEKISTKGKLSSSEIDQHLRQFIDGDNADRGGVLKHAVQQKFKAEYDQEVANHTDNFIRDHSIRNVVKEFAINDAATVHAGGQAVLFGMRGDNAGRHGGTLKVDYVSDDKLVENVRISSAGDAVFAGREAAQQIMVRPNESKKYEEQVDSLVEGYRRPKMTLASHVAYAEGEIAGSGSSKVVRAANSWRNMGDLDFSQLDRLETINHEVALRAKVAEATLADHPAKAAQAIKKGMESSLSDIASIDVNQKAILNPQEILEDRINEVNTAQSKIRDARLRTSGKKPATVDGKFRQIQYDGTTQTQAGDTSADMFTDLTKALTKAQFKQAQKQGGIFKDPQSGIDINLNDLTLSQRNSKLEGIAKRMAAEAVLAGAGEGGGFGRVAAVEADVMTARYKVIQDVFTKNFGEKAFTEAVESLDAGKFNVDLEKGRISIKGLEQTEQTRLVFRKFQERKAGGAERDTLVKEFGKDFVKQFESRPSVEGLFAENKANKKKRDVDGETG